MKVLFAVHPEFAEKIISGEKRYELRKRLPTRSCIDGFVLYSTLPVGKVVAQGQIGEMLSLPSDELWDRVGTYSGLRKADYDRYFNGTHRACAVELLDVVAFDPPVALSEYAPYLRRPPQSYVYVD